MSFPLISQAGIAMLSAVLMATTAAVARAQQMPVQALPSVLGAPLAASQLAGARGTGAISIDTTLAAAVSSNTASQLSTGANTIQGGAFAGASGVPVVIQNTGANVSIQNATVIHLQMQ